MSISKLFVKIFQENIFDSSHLINNASEAIISMKTPTDTEPTINEQMEMVKAWLKDKLEAVEIDCMEELQAHLAPAKDRLGPTLATFDVDFSSTVRLANDRLSARSQGNFNTIKANVCIHGGSWMYEVQLHTKGVMQIGWCSNKCSFNENSGVGDTKLSYGFDGSKQQIWHISTEKYGEKWQIGDVIGITIDVDNEEIQFYRNGKAMGVAFNELQKGPGITFFPAVSLGYNQSIQANFGNTPFKYPIEGFAPLTAKPIVELKQTELLLNYLVNLCTIIARYNCARRGKHKDDKESTKKTVYIIFCTLLLDKLSQTIFNNYVIEDQLLPCIRNLSNLKNTSDSVQPGHSESALGALLNIMWNYLEAEEMRFILKKLANALLSDFTHTHKNLDYENQRQAIQTLIALCNHSRTRKSYLDFKFFKKHYLALFMNLKAPQYAYMQTLLPSHITWTDGLGGPKYKYLSVVEKIAKSTEFLYALQKTLLLLLLTNNDGDQNTPSSRKIFLAKFRRYLMDLSMEQRPFHTFFFMQSSILHPLDNAVALAFVCIFIDVTKILFDKELSGFDVAIPPKYFYDGSWEYQHYDRVGGVLSHLRKVHRTEISHQIGSERAQELLEDDRVVVRVAELADISIVGRSAGTNATTTFTTFLNPRITPAVDVSTGNSNNEASLCELLDLAVLFYYSVGHKYIIKICSVRDEIAALNDILNETKFYHDDLKRKLDIMERKSNTALRDNFEIVEELHAKFSERENVFMERSKNLARKQAWYRAVALSHSRRLIISWLLDKILQTLQIASEQNALFSFIPEVYINILPILLDTVMDFSYHDLVFQFEVHDSECVIIKAAEFLGTHAADQRIILASCKDSLLQALGTLTCHRSGISALEKASKKSRNSLVAALLRPYENRAWGQSNWLLLRFWLGEGFAYKDARQPNVWQGGNTPINFGLCRSRARNESHTGLLHNIAPPNPSKQFQSLVGEKLSQDEPFATTFLNSVLGQLNWAFSEFILLLQEIQNTALRQENTVFEPKQLKICSMCFELTVSLMRCLEMVITVAPDIFHDSSRPNGDLILNRVCQLISQVLSRVTVPPGCFQFVVDMCSADLNAVTHFPIITAALGILLALLRQELNTDKNPSKVTRIARALLTDPSFQFANLEFALGEIKTPILQQSEIPRGNFDPSTRGHIDPLTNDVRIPQPSSSSKRIRADPPIIKFTLSDFPTHVTSEEIDDVRRLIEMLKAKQALLSDITLPSEDSLCPICCAKPITVTFTPCKHQSCSNCILQHLMNSKVCFYCKTLIKTIEDSDGKVIYQNTDYIQTPSLFDI